MRTNSQPALNSGASKHHTLDIKKVAALSVVAAFVGTGFSTPAAGATPAKPGEESTLVAPESSAASELRLKAEEDLLKGRFGIDVNNNDVALVDDKGKVAKTKRKNVSTVNAGWSAPVKKFGISAIYGQAGGWSSGHHTGLDFTAPEGSAVLAAADGKVISSEYEGAYGNLVKIAHKGGITTWYAHLGSTKVKKGDTVKAGQKIGAVGMTGNTSGPHLHFEVRKGAKGKDTDKHVNPASYIWKNKKLPQGVKRG